MRHESRTPLFIVLSGPSGVGKDSIILRLKELGRPYHFVVTATTRSPRPAEADGVDYHFLSQDEFDAVLEADGFIEHAHVYGRSYGVPRAQVAGALESGKDVIMRIDVQGAATIRRLAPTALLIFVAPPSVADLAKRLELRDADSPESIARRLATVPDEMERIDLFDYVVTNEDGRLDDAVAVVEAIIAAEHARVIPRKIPEL